MKRNRISSAAVQSSNKTKKKGMSVKDVSSKCGLMWMLMKFSIVMAYSLPAWAIGHTVSRNIHMQTGVCVHALAWVSVEA